MKLTRLILGLAACAGLCACTNDEPAASAPAQEALDGNVAYMVVKISDVGTSTRATEGGYQNGSATEYAVTTADFYFYDDAGIYVTHADVWDGGTATDPNQNIEFEGNTVIVLQGLTSIGYPKYVVTVLNKPAGFTQGQTLSEMEKVLANTATKGIYDSNSNFTMSTSSYVNDEIVPFVTKLEDSDFYLEPIDMNSVTPVEIYVERLAAKVEVNIAKELAETATQLTNGETGYKISESFTVDEGVTGDVDTDIYVVINGWALNGTAKNSYVMKNIDATAWASGIDGWTGWSAPTDFRSFWGMSYNYGETHTYPTTSGGASSSAGEGETLDSYLDYVSYNDLDLGMGGYTYCAENTNTPAVLGSKISSGITNVMVAATACDVNGDPLDLIRYNGELFTETGYLNYVMSYLTADGELNVYALDSSTGEDVYTHIDGSYIMLANLVDGYVNVVANENAFTDDAYYEKQDDGTFVAISADDVVALVDSELENFNTSHTDVNSFNGGLMYYNIPIEHLNDNYSGALLEANYGVVRNHWYSLTITAIENLGKGVYDPDEVIIPNEDIYYYIAARINILSWKLVSQSVTL